MAYTQLSGKDLRAFLENRGTKRVGVHQMSKKVLSWVYCARCGLVALKNDVSRAAVAAKCVVWED